MNSAWLWLTSYVVNAAWQVPLMAVAGWGLSRWLSRACPEIQQKIWVTVLILVTLAPAAPMLQQYFVHETSTGAVLVSPRPEIADVDISLTTSQVVLSPTAIYAVSAIYLGTVIVFLLRLCRLIRCTSKLVCNAEPALLGPDSMRMWDRSKDSFSVQMALLLRSDDISGPVTAGFWRPVVLLPATFPEEHSPTEFLAAVGHECAHIQRNDFRKNLLYEAVSLLTAFHPATWFIKSQIAQTREMVCDRMAAEQLLDKRTYAQSLLKLAAGMRLTAQSAVFHTVGMFHTSILERRVMTVMTALPRVSRIRQCLLGVSATLFLSVCAGVSGWLTPLVAAQTPKPSAQQDSRGKKQPSKDLSCTYYDEKTVGYPGTCGFDKQDKTSYRCYSNQDPTKSNLQIGCEWKVLRALDAKKKK